MRSLIIALCLTLVPVIGFGDIVHESVAPSEERNVPLMENWQSYTDRGPIRFQVCSDLPVQQALDIWNQAIPLKMSAQPSDCSGHFGDGVSQIYAKTITRRAGGKPVVGYYTGTPTGEEDIVVDPERVGNQTDLLSLLLHELGHALGLGDAYRAAGGPGGCGWSVMLSVCADNVIVPQDADLQALHKIHNWNQSQHELSSFDENDNGLLDDGEFFNVVDAWANGNMGNATFFKALDAWTAQEPIGQSLNLRDAIEITIYHLDGTRVARIPGHSLPKWQRQADNGTYLYRARFPNGIQTGKLAVI